MEGGEGGEGVEGVEAHEGGELHAVSSIWAGVFSDHLNGELVCAAFPSHQLVYCRPSYLLKVAFGWGTGMSKRG